VWLTSSGCVECGAQWQVIHNLCQAGFNHAPYRLDYKKRFAAPKKIPPSAAIQRAKLTPLFASIHKKAALFATICALFVEKMAAMIHGAHEALHAGPEWIQPAALAALRIMLGYY